ncbi:MAG: helix-turn-helix transcriptional regulator, partial [Bacteroidota bacterium]
MRLDRGLLQKDVAKILGVTESCVYLWERGTSSPRTSNMEKVTVFL